MNEFKHTPGKWEVDKEKSGIVHMNDYFRIEQIATAENMPEGMELDDLEAEGDANAKLIAASPELLEDLQMAYRLLKSIKGDLFDEWPEAIKIKETIEKATK